MAESSKSGRRMVSRHIKKHRREGMKKRQAVAAALSEARRSGKKVSPRRRGARKSTKKKVGRKMTRKQAAAKAGRASARARKKR